MPDTPSSLPIQSQCGACEGNSALPFAFSMAFQPIVDADSHTVFAYEALVRGPAGEPARTILDQVTEQNRYAFDQNCRVKAIELASKLGLASQGAKLSVNFMPGAVYSPAACIRRTLATASETGFPLTNLIFELTEDERVRDVAHLQRIVTEYKRHGFSLAMDDFGAIHSGMNLLAELHVDIVKLDGKLIRGLHSRPRAIEIVRHMVKLCESLQTSLVAECIETVEEYTTLRALGIRLMQGYLFATPSFQSLPEVRWP